MEQISRLYKQYKIHLYILFKVEEIENYLKNSNFLVTAVIERGHAVVQVVEALCYKPEGQGFDS